MKAKLLITITSILTALTLCAQQPPVACFYGEAEVSVPFCTVSFSDLSLYDPTYWEWSFPGGMPSSSLLQNPIIDYFTPGIYDVTMTVTNGVGTDTETKIVVVIVDTNICYFDTTIGSCDSTVGIDAKIQNKTSVDIIPQPLTNSSIIKMNVQKSGEIEILFFDAWGKLIKRITTFCNEYEIKRTDFDTGIFFYQMIVSDKEVYRGTLVVE